MSRETVACVTLQPAAASASRSSCCVPSCIRPIRLRTSFWRSSFAIDPLPHTARCLQAPTAGERVDMLRKAMSKADQTVESAADKLDGFVRRARASGGVKAKVADALAEDPDFLRKLKPTLMAARARGPAPPSPTPAREP